MNEFDFSLVLIWRPINFFPNCLTVLNAMGCKMLYHMQTYFHNQQHLMLYKRLFTSPLPAKLRFRRLCALSV